MITIIIFSACFAFYSVEVVQWYRYIKFIDLDRKPFNCTVCMSAWVGLLTGIFNNIGHESIYTMFIAGVAGLILKQLIYKIS